MNTRAKWLISFLTLFFSLQSQTVSHVYKTGDLLKRIDTCEKEMVVNFWATWCKPCVQEIPAFDSLARISPDIKVLLVSLDFKEDLDGKVNPFLKKNKIELECVLLDEVNGNDFINKISEEWSGAIPATLFKKDDHRLFAEKKLRLKELRNYLEVLRNK